MQYKFRMWAENTSSSVNHLFLIFYIKNAKNEKVPTFLNVTSCSFCVSITEIGFLPLYDFYLTKVIKQWKLWSASSLL